jgi:orotate phosphoribosyltransferase
LNVDTIAGPVLSGATIATAVATASVTRGGSLKAWLLGKQPGLYECSKHCLRRIVLFENNENMERVLLVDDIISSGETLVHSLNEISVDGRSTIGIAVLEGWNDHAVKRMKQVNYSGEMFEYNSLDETFESRTI